MKEDPADITVERTYELVKGRTPKGDFAYKLPHNLIEDLAEHPPDVIFWAAHLIRSYVNLMPLQDRERIESVFSDTLVKYFEGGIGEN